MDRIAKIKIFVVYCLRNRKTGHRYIGKTSGRCVARTAARKRFAQHIASAATDRAYTLGNAIHVFGHANFSVRVLSVHKTETAAFEAEQRSIARYKTCVDGYNMVSGRVGK